MVSTLMLSGYNITIKKTYFNCKAVFYILLLGTYLNPTKGVLPGYIYGTGQFTLIRP